MNKQLQSIFKLFSLSHLPENYKQAFAAEYNKTALPYLRLTTVIVIIYLIPYYYLDYVSSPIHYKPIWLIRTIGLLIPSFIILFLSFKPWFLKYYQTLATAYVLLGSLSIELMIVFCSPGELCYNTYFLGILIINSLSVLVSLRLKNAALVYLVSFAGFVVLMAFTQHLTSNFPLLFNRLLLFFTMITALLIAQFFIEDSRIKVFLNGLLLKEQNEELAIQNATIQNQKAELEAQNEQLARQKLMLERFNRKLQDSINYAKKIQIALLPHQDLLSKYVKQWHIFFSPKETVSGDFYLWQEKDGKIIIAVADSTGHGVPGAFMSILLTGLLKDIVEKSSALDPAVMLQQLRQNVIVTLKQDSSSPINDGCDISLMVLDKNSRKISFSGANMHGLWITTKQEIPDKTILIGQKNQYKLIQLSASRQPVSFYKKMRNFENIEFTYSPGDKVILFSDGVIDQFNKDFRKLTSKRFKNIILQYIDNPTDQIFFAFKRYFEDWKQDVYQTDDVTFFIIELL